MVVGTDAIPFRTGDNVVTGVKINANITQVASGGGENAVISWTKDHYPVGIIGFTVLAELLTGILLGNKR